MSSANQNGKCVTLFGQYVKSLLNAFTMHAKSPSCVRFKLSRFPIYDSSSLKISGSKIKMITYITTVLFFLLVNCFKELHGEVLMKPVKLASLTQMSRDCNGIRCTKAIELKIILSICLCSRQNDR